MESQYNARNPAVKRLFREVQELTDNPDEDFHAAPLEDNLFEWHFTIRGPADTPFENGLYHGRIILPTEYPMKPPNIIILTPNGRFETNTKICLSISGYHPETWQPSWSIRTALKALIGFMPTPGSGAIGALELPDPRRRELALTSRNWSCPECLKSNQAILASNNATRTSPNTETETKTETGTKVRNGDPVASLRKGPESPESASGDGDGEDVTFATSLPLRPRTSSLQSKPGRGVGKRAHFEDEVSPSASPSVPSVSSAYVFPPVQVAPQSPLTASTNTPSERPPSVTQRPPPATLSTPSVTQNTPSGGEGVSLSAEEMRSRQAAILVERRRQLQQRLTVSSGLPENSAATSGTSGTSTTLMGSTDLARLERATVMLRQIVVLVLVCIAFLMLRRIVLVMEEEEYEEL